MLSVLSMSVNSIWLTDWLTVMKMGCMLNPDPNAEIVFGLAYIHDDKMLSFIGHKYEIVPLTLHASHMCNNCKRGSSRFIVNCSCAKTSWKSIVHTQFVSSSLCKEIQGRWV